MRGCGWRGHAGAWRPSIRAASDEGPFVTRKKRRLTVLLACGLGLGSAAGLSLWALSSDVAFFTSPSQLAQDPPLPGRSLRLGGLVEAGSVVRGNEAGRPVASFRVTDGNTAITVRYTGILPDLFREGQGVVTLGTLAQDGSFAAQEVLAKHDETYMPKEVAEALKRSGHWNPAKGPPPPASTWNTLTVSKAGE
jgi:cytochrome c-type biogenesis protein CcmE